MPFHSDHLPVKELSLGPSLAAMRANEDLAWQAAYPLLWGAAFSVAKHRIGNSDLDLQNVVSEVICEEVMPGLMKSLSTPASAFSQLQSFEELLRLTRTITQRRCIDRLRSAARRKESLTDDVLEMDVPAIEDGYGNDLALPNWAEMMTLIDEELSPPDPELFHDRFALGLTTREIAARRGMPHGTVVSRFARALKRLSEKLKERELA